MWYLSGQGQIFPIGYILSELLNPYH